MNDVIYSFKFWSNMIRNIYEAVCIRNVWFSENNLTKCAPQGEFRVFFFTVATYWVPDLSNINGFSGHFWRSILIVTNCPSYALVSNHINMLGLVFRPFELKITNILKTSRWIYKRWYIWTAQKHIKRSLIIAVMHTT